MVIETMLDMMIASAVLQTVTVLELISDVDVSSN